MSHLGFLSWSADIADIDLDPAAVADPSIDSGVEHGAALLALVDASLRDDAAGRASARLAIESALGPAAVVAAAGVIADFELMNRIADATGLPVGHGSRERWNPVLADIGLGHVIR